MPYRVYKRTGSPYFQAYVSVKINGVSEYVRVSTGETIRNKAIEVARKTETDLLTANGKGDITIDQAFGEYYERVAKNNHSRPEFTLYTLKKLSNYFGSKKPFSSITAADINDFIYAMTRIGNAPGTINRNLVVLSAVINACAKKWKWRAPDVRPLEFRLREPDGRIGLVDATDRLKIYRHAAPHLRLAMRIAYYTGLRRGNILGLQWTDIDFDRQTITVKVKDMNMDGGRFHTAFMPDRLVRILKSLPKTCEFVVTYKNKPIKNLKTVWHDACRCAGMPDGKYRFHDLRHASGTAVVRETQSLFAAQMHLGHKTPRMTQRYAKFLDEDRMRITKQVFDK